jgi:putative acetyltransferase
MTPTIRRENIEDIPDIYAVVRAAFARPGEAELVGALRRANALVVSAVATVGSRIVGHVAFSPVTIDHHPALALAPVAVEPASQRQGIGAALVRWGLDECRRLGHGIVIVLGEPAYYGRFGFTPASKFGIACPFPVPSEAFMLLELWSDAAAGRRGVVRYRPEFELV